VGQVETDKEKESNDAAKEEVKKGGNSICKLSTKAQQSENRKTGSREGREQPKGGRQDKIDQPITEEKQRR